MNNNMMNNMDDFWSRAKISGEPIDIGRTVICDICNADLTDSDKSGGFIFTSKAYCPDCADDRIERIKKYGEEKFIKAMCLPGASFADFVREYRGGNNTIQIFTL